MRSQFAEWLDQLTKLAEKDNTVVHARFYDSLKFWFDCGEKPEGGYECYQRFMKRWNAITENGKHTEATP